MSNPQHHTGNDAGIADAVARDLAALADTDGRLVQAEVQTMVIYEASDGEQTVDYSTKPYGCAPTSARLGLLDIAREKLRRGLFN